MRPFFKRKNFSKITSFFPKTNVLRFSSLRYGADFRRSRLVTIIQSRVQGVDKISVKQFLDAMSSFIVRKYPRQNCIRLVEIRHFFPIISDLKMLELIYLLPPNVMHR